MIFRWPCHTCASKPANRGRQAEPDQVVWPAGWMAIAGRGTGFRRPVFASEKPDIILDPLPMLTKLEDVIVSARNREFNSQTLDQ